MRRTRVEHPGHHPGGVRSTLATAACAGSAATLGQAALDATGAPMPLEAMVSGVVLATGALAAALLTVGCALLTAAAIGRVFGRSLDALEAAAARITPTVLRRAVAVTITTGLGLGSATVAAASEADLGWEVTGTTSAPSAIPAVVPTTPTGSDGAPTGSDGSAPTADPATPEASDVAASSPAPTSGAPVTVDGAATVTVVPGDTLWDLAAAHLPPGSSDAVVAATWPLWYGANRAVVGADPDLIHPGQVLVVPTPEAPR